MNAAVQLALVICRKILGREPEGGEVLLVSMCLLGSGYLAILGVVFSLV